MCMTNNERKRQFDGSRFRPAMACVGVGAMLTLAGVALNGMPVVARAPRPAAGQVAGALHFERISDVPLDDHGPAAIAGGAQVVVDNFSFAPASAAIPVGTTVTWTNHDDIPHNVVSTEQKFKSPVVDTDETFSHTFDVPGTFKYYCSIHPRMTGQVVVR